MHNIDNWGWKKRKNSKESNNFIGDKCDNVCVENSLTIRYGIRYLASKSIKKIGLPVSFSKLY